MLVADGELINAFMVEETIPEGCVVNILGCDVVTGGEPKVGGLEENKLP